MRTYWASPVPAQPGSPSLRSLTTIRWVVWSPRLITTAGSWPAAGSNWVAVASRIPEVVTSEVQILVFRLGCMIRSAEPKWDRSSCMSSDWTTAFDIPSWQMFAAWESWCWVSHRDETWFVTTGWRSVCWPPTPGVTFTHGSVI